MFTAQCFGGETEQTRGNHREVNPKKAGEKNN